MFSKQASVAPLFIAAVAWIIQMGVDAGQWTLSPLLSRGLFTIVLLAIGWFSVVWVHNGLSFLKVPLKITRFVQIIAGIAIPLGLYTQVNLPPLDTPDCAPRFEWLHGKVQRGFMGDPPKPFEFRKAKIIPASPKKYAMTISADGGGLTVLGMEHRTRKNDPAPWQLQPSGIAYRAIYPVFDVGFLVIADNPKEVVFSEPQFECLKDVSR